METWKIETPEKNKPRRSRYAPKGKVFEVAGLGGLYKRGGRDGTQPWWLVFAVEDGLVRPVLANLSLCAGLEGHYGCTFVLARSGPAMTVKVQRVRDGCSVVTIAEESLFALDPGPVDPGVPVKFVSMTDAPWRARCGLTPEACRKAADEAIQAGELDDFELRMDSEERKRFRRGRAAYLAAYVPAACHAVAMLDHRVAAPVMPGPGFALYLMLRAIGAGLAAHMEVAPPSSIEFFAGSALQADPPFIVSGDYEEIAELIGGASRDFIAA